MLIKLDSLSRRGFLLRLTAWVLVVVLFVFIGKAGPKPLQRFRHSAYNCPDPDETRFQPDCHGVEMSKGGLWEEQVSSLTPMNQFLVLEMQAQNLLADRGISKELHISVTVVAFDGLDHDHNPVGVVPILVNRTHLRPLQCDEFAEWCDKIPLLHLSWLEHANYMVSVDFHESVGGLDFIGDVAFQFTTVNNEYTEFTIVVKWLYILLALEVYFLFRRRLLKVRPEERLMPQRWVASLLVGLLMFNDPLCLATLLGAQPSWIVPLVSLLLQTTFLFLLLLFWIMVLEVLLARPALQVEVEDGRATMVKYVLVASSWLGTCVLLTWLRVSQAQDPMLTYASDFPYYEATKWVVVGASITYCFWIAHMTVKARDELDNDQYRRFFTTLLLSLTVAAFIVVATLLHVLPYVGEGELVHTRGSHFAAMLAIVNWYCFIMAYFFLPTSSGDQSVYESLYKEGSPDEL